MAETVSFKEYRDAVISRLAESAFPRDKILLNLGRVMAQVTEEQITPRNSWNPSFHTLTNALVNAKDAVQDPAYARGMEEEILDPLHLGAADYLIDDAAEQLTHNYFGSSTQADAFIQTLGEFTQHRYDELTKHLNAFDKLVYGVIRYTAARSLVAQGEPKRIPKVTLGEDEEDRFWFVTDAHRVTTLPEIALGDPIVKTLTLKNHDGLIVQLTNGNEHNYRYHVLEHGEMVFRYRYEENKNWSNYIPLPKKGKDTQPIHHQLSPAFFNEIEDEIAWERTETAHEL